MNASAIHVERNDIARCERRTINWHRAQLVRVNAHAQHCTAHTLVNCHDVRLRQSVSRNTYLGGRNVLRSKSIGSRYQNRWTRNECARERAEWRRDDTRTIADTGDNIW